MNLLQNTLPMCVALAFCCEAVAGEMCLGSAAPRTERTTVSYSAKLYQAQLNLKPKKSESPGRGFIPPSVAAKRAQRVFGGKILAVRLRGAIYIVKLRGKGHVRKVRVNAITGRVIGR